MPTDSPALDRPRFHVWIGEDPEDEAPEYMGVVTVTNADQLTAETQARGLGLHNLRDTPFHLTNLWLWAAAVRRGLTTDKFKPFTARLEYRPVEDEGEDQADPTHGAPGPSTDSDSP